MRTRASAPCLAAALLATALLGPARTPDLVLSGTLTGADHQSYRFVPFTVPPGTARITVSFAYTGREQRTTIDLGLVGPDGMNGPDGFRGWSGGNKSVFTVSAVDATPSYLPGPIRSGTWALLLGVPNIRPQVTSSYAADVYFSPSLAVADEPELLRQPLNSEERWYRGDFHAHSGHSDGWMRHPNGQRFPVPPHVALDAAAGRRLDFLVLSEHNTPSVAASLRGLQPLYPTLLLVPGQELTTFRGHANIIGSNARFDFRVTSDAVPDWDALLQQVQAEKALITINHPVRPSDESCLGCGWTADADFSRIQAIEVVNGRDAGTVYSGIPYWHEQLNKGHRIVGIGGSDTHGWGEPAAPDATNPRVGEPMTGVHARELSVAALLEGVRRGRVFIDVTGQPDRLLDFEASAGDIRVHMGEELRARAGQEVAFTVNVTGVAGKRVDVIMDGRPAAVTWATDAHITQPQQALSFTWRADGQDHWARVNVVGPDGELKLIGNPIYLRH